MATVWLVDIEGREVAAALEAAGHRVVACGLDRALSETGEPSPDVGIIRFEAQPLPSVVRRLAAHSSATAWVLLLPTATPAQAAQLRDGGATEVCLEPLLATAAEVMIERLLHDQRMRVRLGHLQQESARGSQLSELIGDSSVMRELLEKVQRVTRRSAFGPALSIILTGETGTGKGLLARVLHYSSRRRDFPFVELNCAAIPAALLEAELFGHERGAFTDAKTSRVGLLEAADGGTIFLDEISYLTAEGQAKLLTVLETRRVRRLGSTAERQVDVQVIAASSHDLQARAAEQKFKPELLHRLGAMWFKLPPLRSRGADATLLAQRFLARITESYRLPPKQLSAGALEAIQAYPWPGNVRELHHAIGRAVLYEDKDTVEAVDLVIHGREASRPDTWASGIPTEGLAAIDTLERELITRSLEAEKGNVTRAAALLKVTRDVLRSRIEKYGLKSEA